MVTRIIIGLFIGILLCCILTLIYSFSGNRLSGAAWIWLPGVSAVVYTALILLIRYVYIKHMKKEHGED